MSDTYTTSQGFKIEFISIPRAIQKFQLAHPQPEPPTYDLPTATGVIEKHPHTEKTLETDADKAAWKEYQNKLSEHTEKFLRVCFVKGILVHAAMDEWLAEQQKLEIPISDDPTERKIEWITDRIVVTQADFEAVTLGVMKASGAPEELLTQIESLFRGALGESNGNGTEEPGDTVESESMVLQPIFRGQSDSLRPENTQESIRPLEKVGQAKRARRAAH